MRYYQLRQVRTSHDAGAGQGRDAGLPVVTEEEMNTIAITIRIPEELANAARKVAAENHRSLNGQVVFSLERACKQSQADGQLAHSMTDVPHQPSA